MAATPLLSTSAALLALLVTACATDSTTTVIIDDPVDDTVAEGEARGEQLADEAFDELSGDDYIIQIGKTASILAAVNDGEINQADFAIGIIADDDVFAFASDLIVDHDLLNIDLDTVARFYGIGYVPSRAADSVRLEANAGIGRLRGTPPGQFDFAFVELQVIMHAQALVLLDELYLILGDGEMGDFILDTQDMMDLHLAEAEALLATYY
jgi:predicted outer membrane protein